MPTLFWYFAATPDVPAGEAWLAPGERTWIEGMPSASRRDLARLSRYTAKVGIAATLGIARTPDRLRTIEIHSASDGAPDIASDGPAAGYVISLSHRSHRALCMIIEGDQRIGCDLEIVEARSTAFMDAYFTESENRLLADARDDDRALVCSLIWSAKESVLKVLRTGLRRDLRSVEVSFPSGGIEGWNKLSATVDEAEYSGWWTRLGDFVLTCATDAKTPPPQRLLDPERLTHQPAPPCA